MTWNKYNNRESARYGATLIVCGLTSDDTAKTWKHMGAYCYRVCRVECM